MTNYRKSLGFTLLELMLVLGLIAALTIGAFVIYPKVRVSGQAQSESSNLTTIAAGTRILYGSNYEELSDAGIIAGRVYPDSMLNSARTSAKSSFGQPVTVLQDTVGPAGNEENSERYFNVVYSGVPSALCVRLGSGVAGNFSNVTVAGSSVFKVHGGVGVYQMDLSTLTTQCNVAPSVDMIFVSE
jgi:type II secretory pathway pseudopilin PulG